MDGETPEVAPQGGNTQESPRKAEENLRASIHQKLQAAADAELASEGGNVETPTGEPEKKATPKKAGPQAGGDDLTTLKSLAEKLGLEVHGDKVSLKERTEFRDWKKRQQEQLTLKEQQLQGELEKAYSTHKGDIDWAKDLKAAKENGDYQKIASLLEAKDWDDLQRHVVAQLTDPNYKKLRELEAWKEETAKKEAAAQEAREREAEENKRAQETQRYRNSLVESMKGSKHGLLTAMHDDPIFANTVFAIQKANWDGETVLSPEQTLKLSPPGSNRSFEEEMKSLYDKLHSYFGKTGEPAPAVKKAPKSAPIPPSKGGGSPSTMARMSDSELKADIRRRLSAESRR